MEKVSTHVLSDEIIMRYIQKEKLHYMDELFQRYSKRLFNYFLKSSLDREESEDMTQITFIRVMKYRRTYDPARSFETWIFQIARNILKDHFAKLKRHKDHFDPMAEYPEMAQDEMATQLENEQRLYQAMSKLSDDKRELLVMSKFEKMKYEQIAEIRQTSVGAIKVQVHRAIADLRRVYFETEQS